MEAGPSKEQLESLYKTSRKYFDELAKEYYTKDREFYNKNFAPFYSNPLLNARKSGRPVRFVLVVGLLALIAGIAFTILLFFQSERTDVKPVRQSEDYQESKKITDDNPATSVKDSVDRDNIILENKQKEPEPKSEVKENTGKREVRSRPIERQR